MDRITSRSEATKIYLLPNLFTAGNMFFGFLSIIRCIQAKYGIESPMTSVGYYQQAVWFILFALICDALDGRVARMGNKESLFGKEFDSLADIVSFGMAPALMMFFLILSPTEGYPFFRQVGWLIGFIYLLCAGIRLARFNVLTHPLLPPEKKQSNDMDFVGLPVPAAAGVTASMVLVLTQLDVGLIWLCMPGLMVLIAWLMVSTIPFPSFKNIHWQTKARFRTFVSIAILVTLIILFHEFAFALIFLGYIFYGMFRHWNKKYLKGRLKFLGK